jgi:sphingomyelin phosphodiesterase
VKAVHFSDAHVDSLYRVGADSQCSTYLCCRDENGYPTEPSRQASKWGSYQCDLPQATFDSFLDFVKTAIKPDFLFWTGDNSPHNVWSNSEEEVIQSTQGITKNLKDAFGTAPVQIFPIQGNHDTWPINYQDFSYPGINKAINTYAEEWKGWLEEENVKVYKRFGYYSQKIKSKDAKIVTKVIGLNTQSCNVGNWGVLKTRYDPGDQLFWLEKELAELEA